jgi:hypothetical protein
MDGFSKILTDKWKEIIESINVSGYSRKVESVNLFRMNRYYNGHPEIEWCYKVTFNFEDSISTIYSVSTNPYQVYKNGWYKELEDKFTKMFWNPSDEVMPRPGSNSGETMFENSKVDYMTNQGYRFIIQFYPEGFISELRNEKLELIGV